MIELESLEISFTLLLLGAILGLNYVQSYKSNSFFEYLYKCIGYEHINLNYDIGEITNSIHNDVLDS